MVFITTLLVYILTLLWLNFKQSHTVAKFINKVPAEFAAKITLAEHQKAGKYTAAKLRINSFEIVFSAMVLMVWTIGGGINWLDGFWQNQFSNTIHIGTALIISIILIGGVISLPFDIYRTFVLEQKFGFNKTKATTFIGDLFKISLLMLLIGTPFIYAVLLLMSEAGEFWWLFVWLLLTVFSLLMLWIYPSYIAPIFNKFKPLDDQTLVSKINQLLERTGFKSDGVFVMDGSKRSSHGNAYFTGIGKNKRIVFFDTLLQGMNDAQITAILAHELGHFHHQHIRKQMLVSFAITLLSLALLGYLISQVWFFHGLGVSQISSYNGLILFVLTLPIFSFFISPISNYLSRKYEFEADTFAAKHSNADDLITSLIQLYKENAATLTPNHLYSLFHDSHPSASVRINHLKGLSAH